jgi:cytochrome bd ubiquinol oxidase subunit I
VQPAKYGDEIARAEAAAEWTARFGPGDYTPPVWSSAALGFMILIGFALVWAFVLLPLFYRDTIIKLKFPLVLVVLATPFPFIAAILGWLAREGGRQPWAVYGLLRVEDAVTPMPTGVMLASFLGFAALLLGLAVANWTLILRRAAKGVGDPALGRTLADVTEPDGTEPDEAAPEPALAR